MMRESNRYVIMHALIHCDGNCTQLVKGTKGNYFILGKAAI